MIIRRKWKPEIYWLAEATNIVEFSLKKSLLDTKIEVKKNEIKTILRNALPAPDLNQLVFIPPVVVQLLVCRNILIL